MVGGSGSDSTIKSGSSPVVALAVSGCMLPEYYTPGGYSSTCEQRLQESAIDWSQIPEGTMRQSISSGAR
jgi:hypothetical protein